MRNASLPNFLFRIRYRVLSFVENQVFLPSVLLRHLKYHLHCDCRHVSKEDTVNFLLSLKVSPRRMADVFPHVMQCIPFCS